MLSQLLNVCMYLIDLFLLAATYAEGSSNLNCDFDLYFNDISNNTESLRSRAPSLFLRICSNCFTFGFLTSFNLLALSKISFLVLFGIIKSLVAISDTHHRYSNKSPSSLVHISVKVFFIPSFSALDYSFI